MATKGIGKKFKLAMAGGAVVLVLGLAGVVGCGEATPTPPPTPTQQAAVMLAPTPTTYAATPPTPTPIPGTPRPQYSPHLHSGITDQMLYVMIERGWDCLQKPDFRQDSVRDPNIKIMNGYERLHKDTAWAATPYADTHSYRGWGEEWDGIANGKAGWTYTVLTGVHTRNEFLQRWGEITASKENWRRSVMYGWGALSPQQQRELYFAEVKLQDAFECRGPAFLPSIRVGGN